MSNEKELSEEQQRALSQYDYSQLSARSHNEVTHHPSSDVEIASNQYASKNTLTGSEWNTAKSAFKAGWQASFQSGGVGKTLDQIKDEIAKEYGHVNWSAVKNKFRMDSLDVSGLIAFCDEANKRFYAKGKGIESAWIDSEILPEIGRPVEVITEFNRNNEPASDRFIGFLNEEGDLVSLPEDDNYGWLFSECVTFWRYLSPGPLPPSPTTK